MASATTSGSLGSVARERPPANLVGPLAWVRGNLFGSWWSSAVTLALGYLILRAAWGFLSLSLIHISRPRLYLDMAKQNTK